jgi:type II secretory pathway pseudopilin PulG
VELLMAMAVFSVLSLIMMRFYSSAQQIWSKASQRSEIYNDAHIALDLMARELQAAMYDNDNTPQGIYPFWFQKIKNISKPAIAPETSPADDDRYYPNSSGSQIELTQLNFIAATDLKPQGANSNVCEIRYTFVPAGMYVNPAGALTPTPSTTVNGVTTDNPIPAGSISEGWLVRSCTPDLIYDSGSGSYIANTKWNFAGLPRSDAANKDRIYEIWSDANSEKYQKVISGIYSLRFTCYFLDTAPSWKMCRPSRYVNATTFTLGGVTSSDTWPAAADADTGLNGSLLPAAVKIDLSMMSATDWREWKAKIDRNDIPGAEVIKLQRMRTFSKTIFINNKLSY